ncbi:MAG: hypothetical protein H0U67_08955, partial [Gemmatimonadetes bacterium]|nr:hypothetical protein [Gemmatimonadota bacterium]
MPRPFPGSNDSVDRREFLRLAVGSAGALAAGGLASLGACDRSPIQSTDPDDEALLGLPETVSAVGLSLTAAPGTAALGGGRSAPAWLFNGLMPG